MPFVLKLVVSTLQSSLRFTTFYHVVKLLILRYELGTQKRKNENENGLKLGVSGRKLAYNYEFGFNYLRRHLNVIFISTNLSFFSLFLQCLVSERPKTESIFLMNIK